MLVRPLAFIKGRPQSLVHKMVLQTGIYSLHRPFIPLRAPCHMFCKAQRFLFHLSPFPEFIPLLFQIILFQKIPEEKTPADFFRQVGKINVRQGKTDSLQPQQHFFPVLTGFYRRQRVRIFRAEAVDNVGPEILIDFRKSGFQPFVILFRARRILIEAVGIKNALISTRGNGNFLFVSCLLSFHGEADSELYFICITVKKNPVRKSRKPAFFHVFFLPQMSGHRRKHDITNPEYPHTKPTALFCAFFI